MMRFVLLVFLTPVVVAPVLLLIIEVALPSGRRQEAVLGIVGIVVPIIAAVIAAAVSTKKEEKRREAEELKRLEAERQVEKERRLEESKLAWWQDERERREREESERRNLRKIRRKMQEERGSEKAEFVTRLTLGIPPRSTDVKYALYGWQEGRCNGCGVQFHFRNLTVDHVVPRAKGGADHADNLQLLCGACNSLKGTGTQAELLAKLKTKVD